MSSSHPRSSSSSSGRPSQDSNPASRSAPIAVDDQVYESDEYDSSVEAPFSVTSSVYQFEYENGRRYHSYRAGRYMLPNDETEQDRLDILHHLYALIHKGDIYQAPLDDPKRILDVGTGTGIFALTMADLFPDAEVIGSDLSPIQPEWVPPNCHFEVDDCEEEWTFPPDYFDFIHSRHLAQSIKDWPAYLERLYRHTAPGGYVELSEHEIGIQCDDGTYTEDSALHRYITCLKSSMLAAGLDPQLASRLRRMLQQAGFTEIKEEVVRMPWGQWPSDPKLKEVGAWVQLAMASGLEAYAMASFTRYGGMTEKQARENIEQAKKELFSRRVHCYDFHFFLVARKPATHQHIIRPEDLTPL